MYKESLIYKLRLQALSIYIIQENKTLMILQKLLIIIWENGFCKQKKTEPKTNSLCILFSHMNQLMIYHQIISTEDMIHCGSPIQNIKHKP